MERILGGHNSLDMKLTLYILKRVMIAVYRVILGKRSEGGN
jgi:hypothetical protein